jgi:protocatechuate 3,4-dioxygenase, alpha subunit
VPGLTPFQTIGPFFHGALLGKVVAVPQSAGRAGRIQLGGSLRDGAGAGVSDALLEIWQPDTAGFARAATGPDGEFAHETVLPGPLQGPGAALQAPHLLVQIFARGILSRLVTRIYFEGQPLNAQDPVLELVPAERRSTLIARRAGAEAYRIEIVLQGDGETVFFDV